MQVLCNGEVFVLSINMLEWYVIKHVHSNQNRKGGVEQKEEEEEEEERKKERRKKEKENTHTHKQKKTKKKPADITVIRGMGWKKQTRE